MKEKLIDILIAIIFIVLGVFWFVWDKFLELTSNIKYWLRREK